MAKRSSTTSRRALRSISEAAVSFIELPVAIVADGEEIIAHNAPWARVTGTTVDPAQRLTLSESLRDFTSTEALVSSLRSATRSFGVTTLRRAAGEGARDDERRRSFTVRWRQIEITPRSRLLAMVAVQDADTAEHTSSFAVSQQALINQLLIRQTIIEESERRRLGGMLHDVVVQDLAQVRQALRDGVIAPGESSRFLERIDGVIEQVRTLSFELSPPVLEDLGLRPALGWLADHMIQRYGAKIVVADNACEPILTKTSRTIVFRAVRELAINAAKHAHGAEIIISCITNHRVARIIVSDNGPGFDAHRAHDDAAGAYNYGLLSVEQQIRGIGGTFELVSVIGEGTRATITVPCNQEKDTADD